MVVSVELRLHCHFEVYEEYFCRKIRVTLFVGSYQVYCRVALTRANYEQ